jgi:hypothetical protein
MSISTLPEHRAADGRFAPGHSGNPAGRPKGARNRTTLIAEALLEESTAELAAEAIGRARAGDGAMLRFFLSRLLPPAKSRAIELALPEGWERDPLLAFNAVFKAMAEAELAIDEAHTVAKIIAIGARLAAQQRAEQAKAARQAAAAAPVPAPERSAPKAPKAPAGPVSGLYFSPRPVDTSEAARAGSVPRRATPAPAPVFDLYSSTALARGNWLAPELAAAA